MPDMDVHSFLHLFRKRFAEQKGVFAASSESERRRDWRENFRDAFRSTIGISADGVCIVRQEEAAVIDRQSLEKRGRKHVLPMASRLSLSLT